MDKLAENLQRLNEDDLLLVVQMIHDKKSPETMTRNDVDREFGYFPYHVMSDRLTFRRLEGEFHVDLYTLPDSLVRELWDFTVDRLPSR